MVSSMSDNCPSPCGLYTHTLEATWSVQNTWQGEMKYNLEKRISLNNSCGFSTCLGIKHTSPSLCDYNFIVYIISSWCYFPMKLYGVIHKPRAEHVTVISGEHINLKLYYGLCGRYLMLTDNVIFYVKFPYTSAISVHILQYCTNLEAETVYSFNWDAAG